ncbi:MAG: 30S ribosomal protein S21, partial [Mariprofundus sp.]|nr:30S ribosomal protein S21 [Mariprofundus sp.]
MPGIRVNPEEPFEIAMKRFRKQVEKGGVISECRRREAYEKPSIA